MRSVKIMATLGPASGSEEVLTGLIEAGVDTVRLNMSHGDQAKHRATIEQVRRIAEGAGRPVGILMDLAGPKIRSGPLEGGGPVELVTGGEIDIVGKEVIGDARRFSTTHDGWIGDVPAGSRILIDDGSLVLEVTEASADRLTARILVGGLLHERKGVNLPGVHLSIPSLTEKDHSDLRFGVECGVDLIALSFVRSGKDVQDARALIEQAGGKQPVIAKIEQAEAIECLDEVIEASDGVIVARGDLGVETSVETVPVLQKRILLRASELGKVSITATEMLQSMMHKLRPTRAEASDVANAVLDGSDALLLTGETAMGDHPVETVRTMGRVIESAETSALRRTRLDQAVRHRSGSYRYAVAEAAAFAAQEMNLGVIAVFSLSGTMARHLAVLRPDARILAFTPSDETMRQLSVVWGIEPVKLDFSGTSFDLVTRADAALADLIGSDRDVVMMAGQLLDDGLSRMMRIHRIGSLAGSA